MEIETETLNVMAIERLIFRIRNVNIFVRFTPLKNR